jgi:hypothetical protein
MPAVSRRWRMADGSMHWKTWGSETAVHHEATATTHLVDGIAAAALLALRDARHAIDLETLWQCIGGAGLPDENERLMLEQTLQRLAQVGLVVATQP